MILKLFGHARLCRRAIGGDWFLVKRPGMHPCWTPMRLLQNDETILDGEAWDR